MEPCNFYPIFEANQVLTADQLNQLFDFLDRQERCSRNKLIGVGIVCGLEVKMSPAVAPSSIITISSGCGITSEGHLIAIDEAILTRYRVYHDPVKYPLFWQGDTQVPLLELLPAVVEHEDDTIQPLTIPLDDKAVILYLECQPVDLESCTGDDCDEKGIRMEQCVKKLLIARSDLENIIKTAYSLPPETDLEEKLNARFKLPEISIKRTRDLVTKEISDFATLATYYQELFSLDPIRTALLASYNRYEPVLKGLYDQNPFDNNKLFDLLADVNANNPYGIQYYYDFLKDLILAYYEFKDTAFELMTACCPGEAYFPRHLMLGPATGPTDCVPSIYRQPFIAAPIHNGQNQRLQKVLMLFQRLALLIEKFQVPNPDNTFIRITPSKEIGTDLGARSIPYYYQITPLDSLRRYWNFELSQRCKFNMIPSYHSIAGDMMLLNYNFDDYPFLRIEGHIGKSQKDVYDTIVKKIQNYNLPIKTIALKLSQNHEDIITNINCQFQDLELIYVSLKSELVCLLEQEIEFFANLEYSGRTSEYVDGPTGVKGTVKNEAGEPLQVTVSIFKDVLPGYGMYDLVLTKNTTDTGEFNITELDPGEYLLQINQPGYQGLMTTFVIIKDKTLILDIKLVTQFTYVDGPTGVRGFVKDQATGEALPGVNVLIEGTQIGAATDVTGKFFITGINPGNYNLVVSFMGYTTKKTPIVIKDQKILVLDLQLLTTGIGSGITTGGSITGIKADTGKFDFTRTKVQFKFQPGQIRFGTGVITGQVFGSTFSQNTIGHFYSEFLQSKTQHDVWGFAYEFFRKYPGLRLEDMFRIFPHKIYYPVQIINGIEAVVATLVEKLKDFNLDEFNNRYNALTTTAENYKKQIQDNLNDPQYDPAGNEQEILDHLDILLKACSLRKFESLLSAYQNRITELQQVNLFNNYTVKHPGLEHLAGVNKGGTFIIVYDDANTVVADFSLPYICCSECPPVTICTSPTVFKLPKSSFCKSDETVYKFILNPPGGEVTGPGVSREEATGDYYFQPFHADVVAGTIEMLYQVNDNTFNLLVTVIDISADFDFEILAIDVDQNKAEVKFTATPGDAEKYEWDFGDGNQVTVENNPEYTHTFENIAEQPFAVTLKITRAGCSAEITKTVTIEICSAEFTYAIKEPGADTVDIEFTSSYEAEKYRWEFGDGTESTEASPTHSYTLAAEPQTIQVKLTVMTGVCLASHTESIQIPGLTLTIELEKSEFCKNDDARYAFTVIPAGGTVTGPGVVEESGTFYFAPSQADVAVGAVQFTYQLGDRTQTLIVNVLNPVAHFTIREITQPEPQNPATYQVTFNNNSQNANTFTWLIEDGQAFTEQEPVVKLTGMEPGQQVKVELTASMDSKCPDTFTDTITIPATAERTKLQIINNIADPMVEMVDVHLNDKPIVTGLPFRKATEFIEVPAGAVLIQAYPNGFNPISTWKVPYFKGTLAPGERYIIILGGVTMIEEFVNPDPNNRDISLNLFLIGDVLEQSGDPQTVESYFFHGLTDTLPVTLKLDGTRQLDGSIDYGNNTPYLLLSPGKHSLEVTPVRGRVPIAVFEADLKSLIGEAIIILLSGFQIPEKNMNGPIFMLIAVRNTGEIIEFTRIA